MMSPQGECEEGHPAQTQARTNERSANELREARSTLRDRHCVGKEGAMNAVRASPVAVGANRAKRQASLLQRLPARPATHPPSVPSRRKTTTCALVVAGNVIPIPELAPPGSPPVAIYAALGLSALSFAGTFFVAPQFKDQFKQVRRTRDEARYLGHRWCPSMLDKEQAATTARSRHSRPLISRVQCTVVT